MRVAILSLLLVAGCHKSAPARDFELHVLEPSQGDLPSLVRAEVGRAHTAGKRPFVYVHASWCGPCRAIEANLDEARMADALRGTWIIELDRDAWSEKLAAAGFVAPAIPKFFELDENGRPSGRTIDGGAWGDNIPANMAPPLKKFFQKTG